jgi:hypothetical protein
MEIDDSGTEKKNTRAMWIVSIAIVVFLGGAMGINMLVHHDTPYTEGQSQPTPQQQ